MEQDVLRVRGVLCLIEKRSQLCHPNKQQGLGAPTVTAHTSHTLVKRLRLERETTRSESRKFSNHSRSQSTHGFVGYVSTCTLEHGT